MKTATVTITDIQEKGGVYLVGTKIKAGRFSFTKAFSLHPGKGDVNVKQFQSIIKQAIIKEVEQRKAVEPIKQLAKTPFDLEYDNDNNS